MVYAYPRIRKGKRESVTGDGDAGHSCSSYHVAGYDMLGAREARERVLMG